MEDISASTPIINSSTADQFHSTSQERTDQWRSQVNEGRILSETQPPTSPNIGEEHIGMEEITDPDPEWDHTFDLRRHLSDEETRFCKYDTKVFLPRYER